MANRRKIYDITNGRCYYCGCPLDFDNFYMDHVEPKKWGGKNKDNLVPACPDCNHAKSDLSVEAFRSKIASMPTEKHIGRMIAKYFSFENTEVKFYFERLKDGDL